jgi:hypothetical protein
MRNFRIFLLFTLVSVSTFIIFSCQKDSNHSTVSVVDETNKSLIAESKIIGAFQKSDLNAKISSIVETRTNSPGLPISSPCFEQPKPGSFCTANHITTTMSLPASFPRPSCNDMKVEFDIVVCQLPNGKWKFSFSDFEAFYGNCPAFHTWYNSLTPQQKADEQDKWEYELSLIAELNYVQAIAQFIPTNCPERFGNSVFVTDVCYNRCLVPADGFPGFKVVKSFCGTQCCIRNREACKNISGTVLFFQPTFETKGPTCTVAPTVCKVNAVPLSKFCGVTCGPK